MKKSKPAEPVKPGKTEPNKTPHTGAAGLGFYPALLTASVGLLAVLKKKRK